MPPFKTVVINGMVVGNRRDNDGDYADVEFIYNVEPSIHLDDVRYLWDKARGRAGLREVAAKTDGSKLSFIISMDNSRHGDASGMVLNRVALQKAILTDVRKIDLQEPVRKRR